MRIGLAIASAVLLGTGPTPGRAQRPIERGFAVAPDVALRIHNLVGLTRVSGWDRDSVAVVATIPARGGSFFGGGAGRFAKLGVEGQDPSLTGPGSTLEVRVPRAARLWIKSAAATTELTDLAGDIEVTSVTGGIRVVGEPRVATLETIDGDVVVRGPAAVVRVRAGAGAVAIDGARGDVTITTVQGRVEVRSSELDAARIATVAGPVTVAAALSRDARLEIETHDGPVTVTLPPATAARFDLSTVKGSIATSPGHGAGRARQFSLGGRPEATVTIRTFSGIITIDSNRAPPPGI